MSNLTLSPVVGRTPDVPSSIRMYPAGESVYIACCDESLQPHYLEVAGMLYVFMQDGLDFDGVISALTNVIDRLPTDSGLYGCSLDALIELEWISQIVATGRDAAGTKRVLSPDVRRPI
ncbi:MAG: hypothetical protein ACKO14_09325 [Armatimonadota bacterium]